MPPVSETQANGTLDLPTKVLTGFLFFVLGIMILLLLLLITAATAIKKSSFWIRRRRACQRRMDHLGMNKTISFEDKAFYYADICLDALAFHWDDTEPNESLKPPVKPKITEQVSADGTQIPLRFQPEKLYGATSTVHRDNMRKRSFCSLSIQSPAESQRRASMVDSLSFLSPSTCLKIYKATPAAEPSHLSNYKLTYPQYDGNKLTSWNPANLPQIDVTCDQDTSNTGDEGDWIEGSKSDRDTDDTAALSISIPVRRASTTNIKMLGLLDTRRSSCMASTPIPSLSVMQDRTDERMQENEENNGANEDQNMLSPVQSIIKRNSLVEGLSNFGKSPLKSIVGESLTDDEFARSIPPTNTECASSSDANERAISLTVTESPIKVPHFSLHRKTESAAGYVALSITSVEDKSTGAEKLLISFLAAKLLQSPRPWQRGHYSLRSMFCSLNHVQQATLACKDGELGCLRFPHHAQLTFHMNDREAKKHTTTMNQLKITIVESGSKWSTEKEYYHGTVNIQLPGFQVLSGKPEWYPISPAYPVIRIKADLLVSLCQRQSEGVISIGVHEIRNIDLQKKGPFALGDLGQFSIVEQSGFEIHACLTYDGRLLKSKKSIFLQQARNSPLSNISRTSVDKRLTIAPTKHRMSFSRTVSGEHYLQFSLPDAKKNIGRSSLSNYGIVLFVTHKLVLSDQLPADFVNQLKLIGAPELKSIQAVGECFIADESTQSDYWKKVSFEPKRSSQSAALWNEATNQGCSRVYQWLITE